MKTKFKEYFEKENEIENLWKDPQTQFVFDTNIILNFYMYNKQSLEEIFGLLCKNGIMNRFWLPYQVAKEFLGSRLSNIKDIIAKYDQKINFLETSKKFSDEEHPFLRDDIKKELNTSVRKACDELGKEKKECEKLKKIEDDIVFKKIEKLFQKKIGDSFSIEKLLEIAVEGEKRYRLGIPPGFEDVKKTRNRFGDLIIWKEILEFAEKGKYGIVFITEDEKVDWWIVDENNKKSPHPELIKEFQDKVKTSRFDMSNFKDFINKIKTIYKQKISSDTMKTIENIQKYSYITGFERMANLFKTPITEMIVKINEEMKKPYLEIGNTLKNLALYNSVSYLQKEIDSHKKGLYSHIPLEMSNILESINKSKIDETEILKK